MSADPIAFRKLMPQGTHSLGWRFKSAFTRSRIGLACALTVSVIAIFALHAPVVPVIAGCGGAWVILFIVGLVRSWNSTKT